MSSRNSIALLCASLVSLASAAPASAQDIWVTMYFAAWTHQAGGSGGWVSTSDVDWSAFTQMNYFSLAAQADGSVNSANLTPTRVTEIVAAAHAHGKPIIVSVGGWGNHDGFAGAISPGSRANFVSTLVDFMTTWGFDGIDIDMEPINGGDEANYIAFINDLRTAMDAETSPVLGRPRLTAAVQWAPSVFASLDGVIDQVNIMTYDNSGSWTGETWHNTSLLGTGGLPSAESEVASFSSAGVSPSHLGIGIDFYAYTWQGGTRSDNASQGMTAPQQGWSAAPSITDNVAFRDIADRYGFTGDGSSHADYRWDPVGNAAYLSVDQPGSANDVFVSYEDSRSIHDKFAYVRSHGLGGVIVWELGGDFRNGASAADRNVLRDAVRDALISGAPTPPPPADAGTPVTHDAGTPAHHDAGSPATHDAGSPSVADAGAPSASDAGSTPPVEADASVPTTDAGPQRGGSGGGGCSVTPSGVPSDVALFVVIGMALGLVVRRKRR